MSPADTGTPGPPSVESVFVDLPRQYAVKEICAADVGPGIADAQAVAELSDLGADHVTSVYSSPDSDVLKALVDKLKSGNGEAFVDTFLSRVGDSRNDTFTLDGPLTERLLYKIISHDTRYVALADDSRLEKVIDPDQLALRIAADELEGRLDAAQPG